MSWINHLWGLAAETAALVHFDGPSVPSENCYFFIFWLYFFILFRDLLYIFVMYVRRYHGKVGQRGTSERSWESGLCGTEGLASAQRLRTHGMPVPYFGGQGWAKAQLGHARNRTKRENKLLGRSLDIKARESYLIQGTICWNFGVRLAWRVNAAFGNASIQFVFGIYGSYFCSYSPLVGNPPPPRTCPPTFGAWFPTQTSLWPGGAIKNTQELSMFCTQRAWLVTGASRFVIGAHRFRKPSCSRGSH